MLAIIDTLLASEKRVPGSNEINYYSVLQLNEHLINPQDIANMYRRLAFLLNPRENRFPYSEQAFELVNDAWAVLSNPMRKSFYDSQFPQISNNNNNNLGFNIEHSNFLSIGNEHELAEPNHSFQARLQRQLQHHNFLLQPQQNSNNNNNAVRIPEPQPNSVRMSEPIVRMSKPLQNSVRISEPQPKSVRMSEPLQLQQNNNSVRMPGPRMSEPVRVSEQVQIFNPMVQTFQFTSIQPEPQPQPQPVQRQHLQPEPQPEQHQGQHFQHEPQAVEQTGGQFDTKNVVREEEVEAEVENEGNGENVDCLETFWTACPYCLYMFEYPKVYVDCVLRCGTCKRAHQAVPVPCPRIAEGEEKYFCCWGYFPVGVTVSDLEKNKVKDVKVDWTPVSTLNDVASHVQRNLDVAKNRRLWERTVYIDDLVDDIFEGISESECSDESSDVEWGTTNTKRKKVKRMKKDLRYKKKENLVAEMNGKNLEKGVPVEQDVGASTGPSNSRRQSSRFKDLEKLDLNVEFNNNDGEEAAPLMAGGTRGNGQGDEDRIEEGIGFFEGLDDFFNNLPILSVGNDETVKAG